MTLTMSDYQFIAVHSTCENRETLARIATDLVENRLAACVQISGPVESIYVWNGSQQTGQEWLLVAKTSRSMFGQVSQRIRSIHTYDVPEIIAVPLVQVSESYQAWMESMLKAN